MSCFLLANVMLPTMFGFLFAMVFMIWPVIAIESEFARRMLQLPYRQTFWACARANFKSTIVGVPLGYFLSLFCFLPIALVESRFKELFPRFMDSIDMFVGTVFFIGGTPFGDERLSILASIVLFIPYYYLSVYIENKSLKKSFPALDTAKIKRTVILMNRASYLFLGLILVIIFLFMKR